ncbi:Methionine synthase activation domain [hydrothermal vent metagenome]|uniref:Methionine synthase activation domain n=1 Tax=hydrothermal vent metagenome TaxID=652676 RepID=A0A3B1BSU1_9ZZZZ
MSKLTVIENLAFTIDPLRVMREMKIPHAKTLDDLDEKPLADSIKKAIDRGYSLIHGKGIYKTFSLSRVTADVVEGDETGDLFKGAGMVKLLGECDFASLLACTIGPSLEAEVEKLQGEEEVTDAFALEMVGGWMADYMADRVDERIEREIKRKGYERTMRFSPGYGDWELDNQPQLLGLLEAEKIGIKLTETNIMIPRKSVSAVIGWKRPSA